MRLSLLCLRLLSLRTRRLQVAQPWNFKVVLVALGINICALRKAKEFRYQDSQVPLIVNMALYVPVLQLVLVSRADRSIAYLGHPITTSTTNNLRLLFEPEGRILLRTLLRDCVLLLSAWVSVSCNLLRYVYDVALLISY
jgi:hypothetical protein